MPTETDRVLANPQLQQPAGMQGMGQPSGAQASVPANVSDIATDPAGMAQEVAHNLSGSIPANAPSMYVAEGNQLVRRELPDPDQDTGERHKLAREGEPERYRYVSRDSDLRSAIAQAAAETDRDPSPAQQASGNYRKGKFHWNGLEIAIENPAGSVRRGKSRLGVEWEIEMAAHYGYIRRTASDADGDHVDCFMGPEPESEVVYVVDQQTAGGRFDEHKCLLGCVSERQARELYLSSYSPGWTGLRAITALTVGQFKAWLESGETGKPIAEQVSRYGKSEHWKDQPRDENGRWADEASDEAEDFSEFLEAVFQDKMNADLKFDLGPVTEDVARVIHETTGHDVSGSSAIVEAYAIRHVLRQHAQEHRRGQLAITRDDLLKIPEILRHPDAVHQDGKTRQGLDCVRLKKRLGGVLFVITEIRKGKKKLAFRSMRKYPGKPSGSEPEKYAVTSVRTSLTFPAVNGATESTAQDSIIDHSAYARKRKSTAGQGEFRWITIGGESNPETGARMYYLAGDGDGIGSQVEQAALANDLDRIREVSQSIHRGQQVFRRWVDRHGGDVIIDGGDDFSAMVPREAMRDLNELRREYRQATGATVTLGVGRTPAHGARAMVLGKLLGKDRVVFWSKKAARKFRKIHRRQSEQEKLSSAGLLDFYAKKWNEAEHPREPAGAATGGQFTEKVGGGSTPTRRSCCGPS